MTTGERTDPYLGFRFRVQLDDLTAGGFSEVSGIEVELETEPYEEGGVNRYTHVLPTRLSHSNVTLERGIADSEELWEWMSEAMHGPPQRKTGQIILHDSQNDPVRGWEFVKGFPVRWSGPELDADQGLVAIESLEIAHQGLDQFTI